ncbi:unnamed protein product [Bursaphelenchus okinawaensis]|uniref:Uncharacterized protein n=1 Tax=Bursaphelenchus okinawaensis TaxID=465554 RepID=A0A811JVG2_9BILA|nr:unnamed protein product [Bursaphelenchus okinawaensis]CAG9085557.1 unnamed protein product [Bursaphelenchus okinawaensis]
MNDSLSLNWSSIAASNETITYIRTTYLFPIHCYDVFVVIMLLSWSLAISYIFLRLYTVINGSPSSYLEQTTVQLMMAGEFDNPTDLLTFIALNTYLIKMRRNNLRLRKKQQLTLTTCDDATNTTITRAEPAAPNNL